MVRSNNQMILNRLNKFRSGLFALADQGVVSVTNAAAGLLIIQFGEKVEYGVYALLFSAILLIQGVQMALVISPYTTCINQSDDRYSHRVRVAGLSVLFAVVTMVLSNGIYVLASAISGFEFSVGSMLCFALAVFGIVLREALRAISYADKAAESAFRNNAVFSILVAVCLGLFSLVGNIGSDAVLLAFGVAGLLSALPKLLAIGEFSTRYIDDCCRYFMELFKTGRWALKGAVLTWFNTNSYNYIVTIFFGTLVVADIAASRLFWMPVGLVIAGWGSIFRPYVSGWYKAKSTVNTKKLILVSAIVGLICAIVCEFVIQHLYTVLSELGFMSEYQNLSLYLWLWGTFFLFSFLRSAVGAALMVSERGYKLLSNVAVVGLVILVISTMFIGYMEASFVLFILIAIELVQLMVSIFYMRKFV